MCQNSSLEDKQIERCVEQGMPKKIIRTVKYALKKKRALEEQRREAESSDSSSGPSDGGGKATSSFYRYNMAADANSNFIDVSRTSSSSNSSSSSNKNNIISTSITSTITSSSRSNNNKAVNVVIQSEQESMSYPTNNSTEIIATTTELNNSVPTVPPTLNVAMPLISHKDATTTTTATTSKITPASIASNIIPTMKIPKMCGRFRQQQLAQNATTNTTEQVYVDALAVSTALTKKVAHRLHTIMETLQSSHIYIVLTRTAQPAHVIAICILSFVALTVWPDLMDGPMPNATRASTVIATTATSFEQEHQQQHHHHLHVATSLDASGGNRRRSSTLAVIAYLGAFATHFGAQIWMTFVSGLSLYFSLPRHTFGQCQQILFPKYFALNAMLSISMLIIFVKYFLASCWNMAGVIQLLALAMSAIIEVTVRLYLAPPMLRLMHEKYKIEDAIGSGQEVGTLVQGDLVQCPHYQRIHKAFRRIHMTVAIGNIIVLLATCLHLYFLASKIQIS